jgi:hypothetical protein
VPGRVKQPAKSITVISSRVGGILHLYKGIISLPLYEELAPDSSFVLGIFMDIRYALQEIFS